MTDVDVEMCNAIITVELSYWSRLACGHRLGDREPYIRKTLKKMMNKVGKFTKRGLKTIHKSRINFMVMWESYVNNFRQTIRNLANVRNQTDRERIKNIFKWVRDNHGYAKLNAPMRPLNDEEYQIATKGLFACITAKENEHFDKSGNVKKDRHFAINYFGIPKQKEIFRQMLSQYGFRFSMPSEQRAREQVLIVYSARNNPNLASMLA